MIIQFYLLRSSSVINVLSGIHKFWKWFILQRRIEIIFNNGEVEVFDMGKHNVHKQLMFGLQFLKIQSLLLYLLKKTWQATAVAKYARCDYRLSCNYHAVISGAFLATVVERDILEKMHSQKAEIPGLKSLYLFLW